MRTKTTTLAEIAGYLDELLRLDAIPDFPGALNGIQVETPAEIKHIATAVDARIETIEAARSAGAQLLIVHHGLFWGGPQPVRGAMYRRLRALLADDIGLYSAHLPLDMHLQFGNNPLLAHELGLTPTEGFARHQTIDIGVAGLTDLPTADLVARLTKFTQKLGGTVRLAGVTKRRMTRHWAICTGAGAGAETLREARARGIDTLIVGEGPHWSAIDAEEQGLAILYGGHYATEVLGVRTLGEHVGKKFGIPSTFIHAPTGL